MDTAALGHRSQRPAASQRAHMNVRAWPSLRLRALKVVHSLLPLRVGKLHPTIERCAMRGRSASLCRAQHRAQFEAFCRHPLPKCGGSAADCFHVAPQCASQHQTVKRNPRGHVQHIPQDLARAARARPLRTYCPHCSPPLSPLRLTRVSHPLPSKLEVGSAASVAGGSAHTSRRCPVL